MLKRAIIGIVVLGTTFQASAMSGKLLLTGGVSQLEGSGGGGLTPWAFIGSYATRDEYGANFHATEVRTQDYTVKSQGLTVGIKNLVELSYSQQVFYTQEVSSANLGKNDQFGIQQDTIGLKFKVYGDGVLDQQTWIPQISVGVQRKENHEEDLVEALGAEDHIGVDYYVSFSKIILNQSFLYNLTLRSTKANQTGFLGFGGGENDEREIMTEMSFGYLLRHNLVLGMEYRNKPNNLTNFEEEDWKDIYLAWAPTKNISLTTAYVDLGNIAVKDNQSGIYTSLQVGF
jgi:hypothetical protein